MQFDGSRPHHPDRARGLFYRRVLFQQNRVLLDSDFSALGDAIDTSMRRLAGITGCSGGSPDEGWRLTTGRVLRLFEDITDLPTTGGIVRRDHAHPLLDELPVLSLEKAATAASVSTLIPLRFAITPRLVRIWVATDQSSPVSYQVVGNRLQIGAGAGSIPAGSSLQPLLVTIGSVPYQGSALPGGTQVIQVESGISTVRIGLIEEAPIASTLSVHAGRYLLGGWDLEIREDQSWKLDNTARRVAAYLEAQERVVSPEDDPGLAEVALGRGQDTTWRTRIQWRLGAVDVGALSAEQVKSAFTQPIVSGSRLGVSLGNSVPTLDPCAIRQEEGYSGPENRLYRVEVHKPGALGVATLLWSRDNASRRQPFQILPGNSRIGVAADGPLRDGELVELRGSLQDETVQLEATLSNGHLRPAAAPPGILALLDDQGLAEDGLTRIFLLRQLQNPSALVPLSAADLGSQLRCIRWEGMLQTTAGVGRYALEEGLMVDLAGGEFWTGEAWTIPARRAIPTEQASSAATSPERHRSPLAILVRVGNNWEVERWLDGRFAPLCSLEARHISVDSGSLGATNLQTAIELLSQSRGGCCPHSMGPGTAGDDDAARLQALIQQQLPADGGVVCLEEGEYWFRSVFMLDRPLKLTGCGRVLIHVEEPLYVPEGVRLDLEELLFFRERPTPNAPAPILGVGGILQLQRCTLVNTAMNGTSKVGIAVMAGRDSEVRISECTIMAAIGFLGGNILGPTVTMKSLEIEASVFHCWANCLVFNAIRTLQLRRSTFDSGLPASAIAGRFEILAGMVEQRALRAAPYAGTATVAAITGTLGMEVVLSENLIIGAPGFVFNELRNARFSHNHWFTQKSAIQVPLKSNDLLLEGEWIEGMNGTGIEFDGRPERLRVLGGSVRMAARGVGILLKSTLKEVEIQGVHVESGDGTGIQVLGELDQLRVHGCTLVANQAMLLSGGGSGLSLQNNRVWCDRVGQSGQPTGFYLSKIRNVQVQNNHLQSPIFAVLLNADGCSDLELRGNRLETVTNGTKYENALTVQNSSGVTLFENRCSLDISVVANGFAGLHRNSSRVLQASADRLEVTQNHIGEETRLSGRERVMAEGNVVDGVGLLLVHGLVGADGSLNATDGQLSRNRCEVLLVYPRSGFWAIDHNQVSKLTVNYQPFGSVYEARFDSDLSTVRPNYRLQIQGNIVKELLWLGRVAGATEWIGPPTTISNNVAGAMSLQLSGGTTMISGNQVLKTIIGTQAGPNNTVVSTVTGGKLEVLAWCVAPGSPQGSWGDPRRHLLISNNQAYDFIADFSTATERTGRKLPGSLQLLGNCCSNSLTLNVRWMDEVLTQNLPTYTV